MQAVFQGLNGTALTLHTPLDRFIASPRIRRLAGMNLCTPPELLADRLPLDLDWDDEDELRGALAEACETAVGSTFFNVRFDDADLRLARQLLEPADAGRQLLPRPTPPAA